MESDNIFSSQQAMELAIKEAKKGRGFVEPNPPVGCVILDSHYRLLSSAYHKKFGEDHAEVGALKKIKNKEKLKGAHVFVTLEPCHHRGKTPACSRALSRYSIASLTYGAEDFFTQNKGLNFLQKKGMQIIRSQEYQVELESLIQIFNFTLRNKKSFVSLKIASSLDGVIALKNGESQWITEKESREHAHFLRATHSAILMGVNTFLQDNPRGNIRIAPFKNKKNKIIILDPHGKSFSALPSSLLLKNHQPDQIILCCSDRVKVEKGKTDLGIQVKIFAQKFFQKIDNKKIVFNLDLLLKNLYQEEQIQSILVEGGAFCWSQFLQQQRAQKLYLYMASKIIGKGIHWSQGFTIQNLNQNITLDWIQRIPLGRDFLFEGNFNLKKVPN